MTTRTLAVATTLACGMLASALAPPARASEGEFTLGSQWWDQTAPEAKYHEFREVPRGGFLESFVIREWAGRNSVALWGVNAIQPDQSTAFSWANGARWRLDIDNTQIPHAISDVARWGWTEVTPGTFTLPDSLQQRNQSLPGGYTQRMTDFLNSAPPVALDFGTNIWNARARLRPGRGWQVEARQTTRKRSGLKPYAMSFGFNTALENPEPISQRMWDTDLIANYQRDRLSLQASAGLSTFQNEVPTLVVDNPKRVTDTVGGDGPRAGALDLYPDNRVVRGTVALAYALPKRSSVTASLSLAHGRQNETFLPFTVNSAMPQSSPDSLPAAALDGKTQQFNGDVRLTTRPAQGLDGALRFNYSDFDNRTEELNFIGQTPYEVSWQRFIEHPSHIYSNRQWLAGADLDYALNSQIKLGVIAELRARDRSAREVEKDKETILGARARLHPMSGMSLHARYEHGDRQMDEFVVEHYEGLKQRLAVGSTPGLYDSVGLIEQPGLRRYDVADRKQDRLTADVSYALGGRIELGASYEFLSNDFRGDTLLGLQEEKAHAFSGYATFHVSEQLDLTGGVGLGRSETDQISRSSGQIMTFNPDSNWTANLKDRETFLFAGFDWAPLRPVSFIANYQFSENLSDYDLGNSYNNAMDLPRTTYRRQELVLDARWHWLESTSLVGRWGWEKYDVDDWATNDVPLIFPVTGTASAIYLGDSSQSYRANRLALLIQHHF